jgi:ribosomal protein S18 acetylase RimI-like enzyme
MAEAEHTAAVVLSVIDTNTRAASFYQQLGYQRLPERDWVPVPDVTLEVWIRQVTQRS